MAAMKDSDGVTLPYEKSIIREKEFAEKSLLVVISGAPGIKECRRNSLFHHKVRDFDTQQKIFEHMTIDSIPISICFLKFTS